MLNKIHYYTHVSDVNMSSCIFLSVEAPTTPRQPQPSAEQSEIDIPTGPNESHSPTGAH